MNTETQNGTENGMQNGSATSWLWLAGAVGTAAGLATLVYARRPKSRWERAQCALSDGAATAGKQLKPVFEAAKPLFSAAKPWMGAAAGVAAGSAMLAYRATRKPSLWEQAREQAANLVPQVKKLMA